jgi:nucleotide-binding universal stress UspA family protein
MIKSILIPAMGEVYDDAVLETALRIAQVGPAHIELLYVCAPLDDAPEVVARVGWAIGGAAAPALAPLTQRVEQQSSQARAQFAEICRRKGVALVGEPWRSGSVTATWDVCDGFSDLAEHARHVDLIFVGRPGRSNGLARSHLEALLSASGRPLLIGASVPVSSLTGTIFICWKESPEAARALNAALPLLAKAQRVVVANVVENIDQAERPLRGIARYLAYHGITAEVRSLPLTAPVAHVLAAAADAQQADLIVLGAYGHSKAREIVFGGCTRSFLTDARVPVLTMQ